MSDLSLAASARRLEGMASKLEKLTAEADEALARRDAFSVELEQRKVEHDALRKSVYAKTLTTIGDHVVQNGLSEAQFKHATAKLIAQGLTLRGLLEQAVGPLPDAGDGDRLLLSTQALTAKKPAKKDRVAVSAGAEGRRGRHRMDCGCQGCLAKKKSSGVASNISGSDEPSGATPASPDATYASQDGAGGGGPDRRDEKIIDSATGTSEESGPVDPAVSPDNIEILTDDDAEDGTPGPADEVGQDDDLNQFEGVADAGCDIDGGAGSSQVTAAAEETSDLHSDDEELDEAPPEDAEDPDGFVGGDDDPDPEIQAAERHAMEIAAARAAAEEQAKAEAARAEQMARNAERLAPAPTATARPANRRFLIEEDTPPSSGGFNAGFGGGPRPTSFDRSFGGKPPVTPPRRSDSF